MNLPKTTLIPEYLESGNSDFEIVKIEEGGETCKDIQSLPLVENIELYKSYIPAMLAKLNNENWQYYNNCLVAQSISKFLASNNFKESEQGLSIIKNGEDKGFITNATIRVIALKEIWFSETVFEAYYVCSIKCSEAWGDVEREIEVPQNSYKEIYNFICKKYSEVQKPIAKPETVEEYLTKLFQRDSSNITKEIVADKIGWLEVAGEIKFYDGYNDFYKNYDIPDITSNNKAMLFRDGFSFLEVGNDEVIKILWLVAHLPYTLFWLRKVNVDFRSVIFLQGATGLLKTAVANVISNVFNKDRHNAIMRMTSTKASIQKNIVMLKDQLVCLDDFSNTEVSSGKRALENAEDVIRAVGDGVFPLKMKVSNFSKLQQENVRSVIMLTGEEAFSLGRSSYLRTLILPITRETFNGDKLTKFQENSEILRRYFALYISFLEQYGTILANEASLIFKEARKYYANITELARFIDMALALKVQLDIVTKFAGYCGISDLNGVVESILKAIEFIIAKNSQSSDMQKPELRFVYALMQTLDTTVYNQIANDELSYINNEKIFVGFKEDEHLWLRFEDAMQIVRNYYAKQGQQWLVQPMSIKKMLLEKGLSEGKLAENGKPAEYLVKAKKGSRKRMLVLKMSAIETLLNDLNMEEV